jgi:hypothetical protein
MLQLAARCVCFDTEPVAAIAYSQISISSCELISIRQEKKDFSAAFASSRNQQQDAASSPFGGKSSH